MQVRRHPEADEFWYDRGMYAKWRADWPASFELNRRAFDLLPERKRKEDPSAWTQILNVPTPDSGHRCGDIVLHDGDPVGSRRLGDRELGVFNEILLWQRSPVPTLTVTVEASEPAAFEALVDDFTAAGAAAQDWTGTVRHLCRSCSEGSPHPDHDDAPVDGPSGRSFGLSADLEQARDVLERWSTGAADRSHRDLAIALR